MTAKGHRPTLKIIAEIKIPINSPSTSLISCHAHLKFRELFSVRCIPSQRSRILTRTCPSIDNGIPLQPQKKGGSHGGKRLDGTGSAFFCHGNYRVDPFSGVDRHDVVSLAPAFGHNGIAFFSLARHHCGRQQNPSGLVMDQRPWTVLRPKAYIATGMSNALTQVAIAHEAGHETKSQFERKAFGAGDHQLRIGKANPTIPGPHRRFPD